MVRDGLGRGPPQNSRNDIYFSWEYYAQWEFMRWLYNIRYKSGPRAWKQINIIYFILIIMALFINVTIVSTLTTIATRDTIGGRGTIEGKIIDEDNNPIPDAKIYPQWSDNVYISDENGRFIIEDVPTGPQKFYVKVNNPEYHNVTGSNIFLSGKNYVNIIVPKKENYDLFEGYNHKVIGVLGFAAVIGIFTLINCAAMVTALKKKKFSYIISTFLTLPISGILGITALIYCNINILFFVLNTSPIFTFALIADGPLTIIALAYIYYTRDLFLVDEGVEK